MESNFKTNEIKNEKNKIIIYTDSIEENETNSPLLNLPDYLIENYIFPYLTWKELFFVLRGTHSYLQDIVKSTWSNIIKEEMCNQLKNLTFLYEKEALTKAYEFKLQYLVNYRNLLIVYHLNANILNIIEICLDYIQDQNVFKLLATFFGIMGQEQSLNLLFEENVDNENKKNSIIELLHSEQLKDDFKNKMEIILDVNSIESDPQIFRELNEDFNGINREAIEEINDNCRLIYSFLQGLLEYQNLKKNVQELKLRLEQLYMKIQKETKLWPKRKKFFETAYKILLYSKSTTFKFRYMNNLYIKYTIKSPFCEYKEESYNSMVELRDKMEIKKMQIMEKLNNKIIDNNSNTNENLMDEVNDILLKNVLDRRLLLTKKILITEKFYDIVYDPNSLCKKINNSEEYNINGEIINIEELLKTLMLVSNACPDDISVNSVLKLYKIKKKLENEKMKENIDNKGTELISKDEAISIEKKSEIILLKKQKENLINQKKKTEQLLNILKKYMQLKENFLKNKQKYKSILFILSKIRHKNINPNNLGNNQDEQNIDKLVEILDCENIDEINNNFENISKEEEKELQNFEVSEGLLKEIETSLMLKIKQLLEEEKNININNNENNENNNIDNQEIKVWNNLGIEKGVDISVQGNRINTNNDSNK